MQAPLEQQFDDLVQQSNQFDYELKGYGTVSHNGDGTQIPDLPLKQIPHKSRTVTTFVDVVKGWCVPDGQTLEEYVKKFESKSNRELIQCLPPCLSTEAPLPDGATVQLVFQSADDGALTVLKHVILKSFVSGQEISKLKSGDVYLVPWRANTHGVRKAFQQLLVRCAGWHVMFASCVQRKNQLHESDRKGWDPSAEELKIGVDYINLHAPTSNARNQQVVVDSNRDPTPRVAIVSLAKE